MPAIAKIVRLQYFPVSLLPRCACGNRMAASSPGVSYRSSPYFSLRSFSSFISIVMP